MFRQPSAPKNSISVVTSRIRGQLGLETKGCRRYIGPCSSVPFDEGEDNVQAGSEIYAKCFELYVVVRACEMVERLDQISLGLLGLLRIEIVEKSLNWKIEFEMKTF